MGVFYFPNVYKEKGIMENIREKFDWLLIREIDYQGCFEYHTRCEIFNKYKISTAMKYLNPIMLLSTFLMADGYMSEHVSFHGTSHSGAVQTAFNEEIKKDRSPYIKIKKHTNFDVVKIFNYDSAQKTYVLKMLYRVSDTSIKIKFVAKDYWVKPDFCYYKAANDFLEDFGFPRMFIYGND